MSLEQSDLIPEIASHNVESHDTTTETNIGDSSCQQDIEEDHGIKFKEWGFKIDRLFEVAHRFYKRNESKAFHPSFDIRNQMTALILQARYGNFDDGRAPDIGTLDLVGKSRRHQWSLLKGMSKAEAMSKFICTLDEICPFFKAYAEAVKINSGIQLDTENSTGGSGVINSEQRNLADSDEQLKAIHTSLCRQTYNQFKNYAEKQHPDDREKQRYLITTMQEQYYQQYISTMQPQVRKQRGSIPSPALSESSVTESIQMNKTDTIQVQSSVPVPTSADHLINSNDQATTTVLEPNILDPNCQIGNHSQMSKEQALEFTDVPITDLNNCRSTNRYEDAPSKSNVDFSCSERNQNDVVIECEPELIITTNNVALAEHCNERREVERLIIGKFESYPEPIPIKKSKEPQQRSLTSSLLNYLGDVGTKQQQNLQSVTTSLYGNGASEPHHELVPPQLEPHLPAPSPQSSIIPDHEQMLVIPENHSIHTADKMQEVQSVEKSVDTWDCGESSGGSSPLQRTVPTYEPLEPATTWTKKGVVEFKESLTGDKHSGTYIVKQGTLLTIRVPTYPDGRYIYWEFATEEYDIGFGLDFIYETDLDMPLALKIHEETDEDDDDDGLDEVYDEDIEQQMRIANEMSKSHNGNDQNFLPINIRNGKLERKANTVSIIPTYRRDSQEEVFVEKTTSLLNIKWTVLS